MSRTPVRTLAVIGSRDPHMPPPWRVRAIGWLAPPHLTVAVILGDPYQPGIARVLEVRREA